MNLIEAIVLGIVQGLTEFLPISSTAHLRIIPALLGWSDPGAAFTASIQLGTLLAVLIYFRVELGHAIKAWVLSLKGGAAAKTTDAKMGWAIFIGTLPIIVLGLGFKDKIENQLRSLNIIAYALIGMGILMFVAERVSQQKRKIETVEPKDGLIVGLWQAVALIPGASRSGSTITGGLFAGFDRSTAARFSFLLSVPSVFAAGVFALKSHSKELVHGDLLQAVIVSNIFAFIAGYASIAILIKMLQTRSTLFFTVYRVVLGIVILALIGTGTLAPDAGLPKELPKVAATS